MSPTLSLTGLLLVAAGGAAGSVARYLVGLAAAGLGAGFPWGTLAVNVLGSALVGLAAGLGASGDARLLLVTGFLGGFTTFSAFSLDAVGLAGRSPLLAGLYVLGSVGLGLAACALTFMLVRR
jgi:CrcB protein